MTNEFITTCKARDIGVFKDSNDTEPNTVSDFDSEDDD